MATAYDLPSAVYTDVHYTRKADLPAVRSHTEQGAARVTRLDTDLKPFNPTYADLEPRPHPPLKDLLPLAFSSRPAAPGQAWVFLAPARAPPRFDVLPTAPASPEQPRSTARHVLFPPGGALSSSLTDSPTSSFGAPMRPSSPVNNQPNFSARRTVRPPSPPPPLGPPPAAGAAAAATTTSSPHQPPPDYKFRFPTQHHSNLPHDLKQPPYLTLLSLEVHAGVADPSCLPDPKKDAIQAVFYCAYLQPVDAPDERTEINGIIHVPRLGEPPLSKAGLVASSPASTAAPPPTAPPQQPLSSSLSPSPPPTATPAATPAAAHSPIQHIDYATDEADLFRQVVALVQTRFDPEILLGYEIQRGSWGYLVERGRALDLDMTALLSRIPGEDTTRRPADEYGARHSSELHFAGRIALNVWRLMRHEVTLTSYTFPSVVYHVLHLRVPTYTHAQLQRWYNDGSMLYHWRVARYYLQRARFTHYLLRELDFVERTSEFARLYGILFHEVISRGSQFRVESIMHRLAKPLGYAMLSPSRSQVHAQRAPEALPLILEPESTLYTSPVIVLDFQSLYPSIIIAYNYCFSTCLGRVPSAAQQQSAEGVKFGASRIAHPPGRLSELHAAGNLSVSPNGIMFCSRQQRAGILPKMLEEILQTRVMVKQAMKDPSNDRSYQRLLNARQLGLKLIANVTYGYTSASFSGRMPCIDIADSIVQKGRETLERAMRFVDSSKRWRAKVVYGDTDSMFVVLPGATKDEAFRIGEEIAAAVTAQNPSPVKLKFEKVYLPCVLQTKKRYVGYSYEARDQPEPDFDDKGIETVRRDNCPMVGRVSEGRVISCVPPPPFILFGVPTIDSRACDPAAV